MVTQSVEQQALGAAGNMRILAQRATSIWSKGCRWIAGTAAFNSIGYAMNAVKFPLILSYRPDFHYGFDGVPHFGRLFCAWIAGNRRNNAGDLTRFYLLIQNLEQIRRDRIPGAFVELGVYRGNSAAILADFARRDARETYLFDTFSGFDARDIKGFDAGEKVRFCDTTLSRVKKLVGDDNVIYVPGFFPASADTIEMPTQVAVAHLDCDLYEPMKAALERFYPLMSPGGLLIMHDYSSGYWPGATRAVDEFFADKPERPVLMPDKSGTAIVRTVSSCRPNHFAGAP